MKFLIFLISCCSATLLVSSPHFDNFDEDRGVKCFCSVRCYGNSDAAHFEKNVNVLCSLSIEEQKLAAVKSVDIHNHVLMSHGLNGFKQMSQMLEIKCYQVIN